MFWYVYMLRCGDGTLYTGITDNVERRLAAHRAGKGAKGEARWNWSGRNRFRINPPLSAGSIRSSG